jgi:hypothetical protein
MVGRSNLTIATHPKRGLAMTSDPNHPGPAGMDAAASSAPRQLQVRGRAGVWEVIRDDRFYGHYMGHAAAFAAAEAAALAIVAKGGSADIRFREQSQSGTPPLDAGSGMRTMEFRPGSAPVVR